MRHALLIIFFCLFGSAAFAQQVVSLDPSALSYEPRLVTLRGCGFAIGLDPGWSHRTQNKGSGKIEHAIKSPGVVAGAVGRFVDEFVTSGTTISITCERADPSSDRGRTAYNKTMADGMRSSYASEGSRPSSVSAAKYGPFRNGYKFDWQTVSQHERFGKLAAINGNVFAHAGDTRVTIFYRQGGYAGPANATRIAAGTVIPASRSTHVKITKPIMQMSSGAMFAVRTLDMERRFIDDILRTIR